MYLINNKIKPKKHLETCAYKFKMRFEEILFKKWLIGFSSFFNPAHPTQLTSFYAFLLSSLAAIIVSFLVTWFWGYNDDMTIGKKVAKKQRPGD